MLSEGDKNRLKQIASETVESWVRRGEKKEFDPPAGVLAEKGGAFVTLRHGGLLRGCIGLVEAIQPLWLTVRDMAVSASSRDPRFPPIREEELEGLDIEISVLSPLFPFEEPEDVNVGEHGLLIRKGHRSGLLLPQVAVEHGWDRETFLDQTCLKAGLPPGCWADRDTEILGFTAEVL
jgi:AmmeMemoRadiSam system protein A